jgi:hypothetical protein
MARQRAEDAHQVKLDAMIDVRKRQAGAWPCHSYGRQPCRWSMPVACQYQPTSLYRRSADRRPGTRAVATSKAARIDEVLDQMQHGSYGYVHTRQRLSPSCSQLKHRLVIKAYALKGENAPVRCTARSERMKVAERELEEAGDALRMAARAADEAQV